MSEQPRPPVRQRTAAFDGLRGIAIVLVVLSHGWTLWPTDGISKNRLVDSLFTNGNLAVSIFFVVGGFLTTRALLGEVARTSSLRVGVALVRRFARISAHTYTLLAVVMFVTVFDDTDPYPKAETRSSVLHVATYTWNWFLEHHATIARPDLGHLWYVCVDMQVYVLLVVLVYFLARRPLVLLSVLAGLTVAVIIWRAHVIAVEGGYTALLRTTTRMDGLIWGALVAVALPYLQRAWVRQAASALVAVGLGGLVVLLYSTRNSDDYFRADGVAINLAVVFFVIGGCFSSPALPALKALAWQPLQVLGRTSLAIYVWHYPIFWGVSRHTTTWNWLPKTVLAFALTAVAVVLAQRYVERPVQRWLGHPHWHEMRGVLRALFLRFRGFVGRGLHKADVD
jgi:peptidoglycan/LPS O-acetylase OafA/YrhL